MPKALSIYDKQQLSEDSNLTLGWEVLDSTDRKIVMAVSFNGSPEIARKSLDMSVGGFYKRWKYLKPVHNQLLNNFPTQAVNIMKAYSIRAAQRLGDALEAEESGDRIKAANSILDRVTPKREEIQQGLVRKITLEEFIGTPADYPKPDDEEIII